MVYQGSKNRLAKDIVPIIQSYIDNNNSDVYIELFGGGCNVADKIKCKRRIVCDLNEDLICLLKYAQQDPELSIAPEDCPFEHYAEVRADVNHEKYSQEYRALIGYMASYGGRYFDGGYGRDLKGGRCMYKERLVNLKKQAPLFSGIEFFCGSYIDFKYERFNNAVIYLDPPYRNTQKYAKQDIDYEEYYAFCRKLGLNNTVICSEYNMPDDFKCIWQKERKVLQKSNRVTGDKAVEKLFVL